MARYLVATTVVAAAAMFAAAGQSNAAGQCAARTDIIKALGEKFHESETARGLVNRSVILEVFVSEQGTWTILATDTHGLSCVISAGEGWDHTTQVAALPGT
ncbi:MAG: hypothetical protein EOS58_08335 [Mesorhizobium sp.]|uniref:hypothetical protein n=1 Tax=unclassified Mesorhizobium TaxID=325217 RepID=UPI000F74D6A4|nr:MULTISPECIES: hypothetical protein [unclassified Mesorhizobium]RVD68844.1 hypothetical protein EN751_29220 [Mesorhizobium sp. M4A.F.Ca.ET.029.04.2.1]AZO50485.1 hypothetical protein EJ073_24300 [Mesorhizobium sp. M4B.F.Ca.ET.058.02.1.1]RUX45276.1 hypothetical protein EOA33_24520 [Mesorhizobium sp. M4A.F.Ca.ET.050.02.1.1]RVC43322.1 hypothetical protein EN781_18655 [Mesorhizobium sp. M4A.F.Ca.ET.090.04.2.1]RVD35651.1 hypothetical protein EN742_24515 [Mesorhizobium sp. M4A.F.Ca.ET.020.02.1.1]